MMIAPDQKADYMGQMEKDRKNARPSKCPFCGEFPLVKINSYQVCWVECQNPKCKVNPSSNSYARVQDAVDAWNRRV